ncbi:KEX1 [Candida pseudojiufengensis]|uniref:KEX1 n=1 Tax=Candida pseudojiufengensis TaxID=497109 RepID=UPI002224A777|nr:KEX1 [Candida pseudojiufengensis]KAI5960785.1 KEX1 [Candida pseudojiufengensis]
MLYLIPFLISFIEIVNAVTVPQVKTTADDLSNKYLVTSLPGMESLPKDYSKPIMYAGEIQLYPQNDSNYFFWKFIDSAKPKGSKNITTFWLNGGPGCSSLEGAFLENGPYRISKSLKLEVNNGSWHKVSDMIYVDQPVGTGFSFANKDIYLSELDQVAQYFIKFLEKYFEIFPQDLKNDLYLSGESYAGQYIPYIANAILKRNANLPNDKKFNLKSILLGNGAVSPDEQSSSFVPFFQEKNLINVNDKSNRYLQNVVLPEYESCKDTIQSQNVSDTTIGEANGDDCSRLLDDLLYVTRNKSAPTNQQCINVYDYTLRDSYPSCGGNFPPTSSYLTSYLNQPSVIQSINVNKTISWQACSSQTYNLFSAINSKPSVTILPDILKLIPIVLYSGADDIICNTKGVIGYLQKMKWQGSIGFTDVNKTSPWIVGNEKAGWVLQERNLTFVNVFNASHLVPYSQPLISRSLFDFVLNTFSKKIVNGETNYISSKI